MYTKTTGNLREMIRDYEGTLRGLRSELFSSKSLARNHEIIKLLKYYETMLTQIKKQIISQS